VARGGAAKKSRVFVTGERSPEARIPASESSAETGGAAWWKRETLDRLLFAESEEDLLAEVTSWSSKPTAYGRTVLADRAARVVSAPVGSRRTTLNAAAFVLGGLVASGHLPEADARTALTEAAKSAGLALREIERTISAGFTDGLGRPFDPPARWP
jgi:hypothetical protein